MTNDKLKGFRYQKRISLGKFLRLNISKSGIGLSIGVRGLRYSRGANGSYLTVGLPGSGIHYRKKLSNKKGFLFANLRKDKSKADQISPQAVAEQPEREIEKPGFFAPGWEKALYRGVQAYHENDLETAIAELRQVAAHEDADAGALLLLAFLLAEEHTPQARAEGIALLERIVSSDDPFPTPMIKQYMPAVEVELDITPQISVTLPLEDGLAPTLLLVELYQQQQALEAAIRLLEEVDDLVAQGRDNEHERVLVLSLAELYLLAGEYREIVERITPPEAVADDIDLGLLFFYGRALQERNLHTAAIQVYTKALRRKKGLSNDLLNATRLWRAMSLLKTDEKQRARDELERILAEAPVDEVRRASLQALRRFWPQDFRPDQSP